MYIASLGPKNVEVTAEIADGWIPVFFHPGKADAVWGEALAVRQRQARPVAGADGGRRRRHGRHLRRCHRRQDP
ncbi:MAG: hypothetical protein R2704_17040 [Microthrixaceae bacterium]